MQDYDIVLQEVWFKHKRRDTYVLKGISGIIEYGKRISIVGPTGIGKSTLAMLLAGIYEPTRGSISIGGTRPSLLSGNHVFYVPSNPHIFIGFIKENITLWGEFAEESVMEVAQLCKLDDVDMSIQVGEGRGELSLGQKQRIALARALLRQPKVLILDEATSGIDSRTEEEIFSGLFGLGITLIMISHRLSTIRSSDDTWVLKDGIIICKGLHDELLKRCEEYVNLFKRQIIV